MEVQSLIKYRAGHPSVCPDQEQKKEKLKLMLSTTVGDWKGKENKTPVEPP